MPPKLIAFEKLYLRSLQEITDPQQQCSVLLKLYHDIILLISDSSQLQFNTMFARVSFITTRYQLTKAWSYALQIPRRELHRRELTDDALLPIVKADIEFLLYLGKKENLSIEAGESLKAPRLPKLPDIRSAKVVRKERARVIAISWDKEASMLHVLDEEVPNQTFRLRYRVHGVNDIFSDTLEHALQEMGLPLVLGLTQIECSDDHQYTPATILIMPDLLMDVTAIAEYCDTGSNPSAINLIDHFLPNTSSTANLTGKVANYFLDELIHDPAISFQALFAKSFTLFPVEFVRLDDDQVRQMRTQLHIHFDNILDVLQHRFPALGIERTHCVIEPSYYSPTYGLKGRLDVYHQHDEAKTSSIIELKSGKPFKPNSYGLSHSHYHQTLLYELLIQSVEGKGHKRANFILYSAMKENPLRYAASVESIQKEALHNRNQVALLQHRLTVLDYTSTPDYLSEIDPGKCEAIKGFLKTNIDTFHKAYVALNGSERAYFKAFVAFIAREHMLARIGNETSEGNGGLAGMWLDSESKKEERYQILRALSLKEIDHDDKQTTLTFSRTSLTNPLASFRAGDIAVLYPHVEEEHRNPTSFQLHRANIISLDAATIVVRLRNNQVHIGQLQQYTQWNIEHDLLDSSFRSLYQAMWLLMCADEQTRRMIMGYAMPSPSTTSPAISLPTLLTGRQQEVFQEGIRAGFLYLLWGPPGTGKTSIVLRSWVDYYIQNTSHRLLLLAYTNRAVDEICTTLEDLNHAYIRIGSRAATGEAYRHRLLDVVISDMTKRSEIKACLESTRIIVGTVASIQGKSEIFELINFDLAIVDEASQLLEPAIVGLITRVRKTILIGDHMQLPAVSVQSEMSNRMDEKASWAAPIGLTDLRMSYFERMYRHYHHRGWLHLIGSLNRQGRMHQEIMQYANANVYRGDLQCASNEALHVPLASYFPGVLSALTQHRLIYISSAATIAEYYTRTNQEEANYVIELLIAWKQLIAAQQLHWTIGVITPFRAQIAAILFLAHQRGVDLTGVTIDTVERYQGGARDIIIMSCTANQPMSLQRISSINIEGVDRKLNVAVTRARQQFILTGVESVLRTSVAYSALIDMCSRQELKSLVNVEAQVYQPEA